MKYRQMNTLKLYTYEVRSTLYLYTIMRWAWLVAIPLQHLAQPPNPLKPFSTCTRTCIYRWVERCAVSTSQSLSGLVKNNHRFTFAPSHFPILPFSPGLSRRYSFLGVRTREPTPPHGGTTHIVPKYLHSPTSQVVTFRRLAAIRYRSRLAAKPVRAHPRPL